MLRPILLAYVSENCELFQEGRNPAATADEKVAYGDIDCSTNVLNF